MRLFVLKDLDEYDIFVNYLIESDQPIFVFGSETRENIVLASEKDLSDPNDEIEKILEERKKDSHPENETLDEIFDYNEDDEDDLIMLFL